MNAKMLGQYLPYSLAYLLFILYRNDSSSTAVQLTYEMDRCVKSRSFQTKQNWVGVNLTGEDIKASDGTQSCADQMNFNTLHLH